MPMKSKETRINVIFAVILLAVAGVFFFMNSKREAGGVARLTYGDDSTVLDIPLNQDKEYDIDTGYYTIHLQVKDGKIAFVDSPCPDHKCEGFGWLSQEDDWAACLPARASITVLTTE
jgi:hypothetical protein